MFYGIFVLVYLNVLGGQMGDNRQSPVHVSSVKLCPTAQTRLHCQLVVPQDTGFQQDGSLHMLHAAKIAGHFG